MLDAASSLGLAPLPTQAGARIAARSASWNRAGPEPVLSVVVPAFRTRPWLRVALDSLVPAMPQRVEVIVVHDGGDDGALELACGWVTAAPMRALVLDQANRGLSAARMTGAAHASGRCLAFLDSDDIADIAVLLRMAADIQERDCDIVLCRSAVLDGESLQAWPFYDAWLWDRIMQGAEFRRVNVTREPRLMRLEPNANPRVMRRSFFEGKGLDFPEGRLFEDMPAHVRALLATQRIGLRGEVGYLYRVNRPGKITDERSARRMDALVTCRMAMQAARDARIEDPAGAELALALLRMLFWCGQNITAGHRRHFFTEAAALFAAMPAGWLDTPAPSGVSQRDATLLAAFRHGDAGLLEDFATPRRPRLKPVLRFLLGRHGAQGRRHARAWLRHRLSPLFRRSTP
ncbi:glycosyltransferase family 2 protein [Rhodovarius crocodyli]|uniref:Glycosyltransferase family 2 protein n=1 Tax=Rhodovarius crocodyli TaxID=1979269 RepID=A0A437MIP9_9PROT|nr:glycosyltransferase family 2 protein [Rhodovarius crocodyli]RVT97534.1 glycosyltransferase family 2 protein [Rhodovarius crocodyli]